MEKYVSWKEHNLMIKFKQFCQDLILGVDNLSESSQTLILKKWPEPSPSQVINLRFVFTLLEGLLTLFDLRCRSEKFWGGRLLSETWTNIWNKFCSCLLSVMLTSVTWTSVSTPRPFTIAILKVIVFLCCCGLFFHLLNSLPVYWNVKSCPKIILIFMQRFDLANSMKKKCNVVSN